MRKKTTSVNNWPAILSACCTLVALLLTAFAYSQTWPKERPVLTLFDNKITGVFNKDSKALGIDLCLLFKNTGQHPARDVKIKISAGVMGNKKSFRNIVRQAIANEIGVGNIFSSSHAMTLLPVEIDKNGTPIFKEENAIFLIRLEYKDAFNLFWVIEKCYKDDFWIVYTAGRASSGHATVEDRDLYKQNLLNNI